jgi:enoyl-CoA hydratase/carnithine racemase
MIRAIEHGATRELRLNHPPANALSPQLIVELRQAVERAPEQGIRALILSGSPGWFSGGLDVPLLLTLDRPAMAATWRDFYALLGALACSPIPIIAAITGHAPAGGTVLALFCDRRIVAQGDWKIGLNEVPVGLPLPPVILAALQRLVGPRQAERLAVGGLLIPPSEAVNVGLVDEIAPADQVVSRAIAACEDLLALPPEAMAITRRQARSDLTGLFEGDIKPELEQVTASWWSEEAQRVLRRLVEELAMKRAQR